MERQLLSGPFRNGFTWNCLKLTNLETLFENHDYDKEINFKLGSYFPVSEPTERGITVCQNRECVLWFFLS